MLLTVVEETAQSHLVTYGMASFNLCKVGSVFFVVMYPLHLIYDISAHFKIKFRVTIMVLFSFDY